MWSLWTYCNILKKTVLTAQELCESGGGRPGLPVPNSPYGLCRRKATVEEEQQLLLHNASTYFGTDALVAISRDSTFDQEQQ